MKALGPNVRVAVALVQGFLRLLIVAFATQASATPPPTPTSYPTEQIWNALVTHCGESYFYAGSALDAAGSMPMLANRTTLLEFRGVKFHTVPIRVTDAERLNGLTAHARVTMLAHTYRKKGDPWQDGPDLVYRSTADIMTRSFADIRGDEDQMGAGGAIALDLMRFGGRWLVRRSSVWMSTSPSDGPPFDLAHLGEARVSRYNCQTSTIIPPPPTAAELRAAAQAKLEADRRAAEQAARKKTEDAEHAEFAAQRAASDAAFAAAQAAQDRGVAPWTFTGSPEEFHKALAANLAKRAAQWGLDPRSYGAEFAKIDEIVATCLAITPDDWQRIQARYFQEMASPGPGPNPVRLRNERLNWCDATRGYGGVLGEPISAPGREHGLAVIKSISESASWKEGPRPTGYFSITVTVLPKKGELTTNGPIASADIPPIIDVIKARIPMPAWTPEQASR